MSGSFWMANQWKCISSKFSRFTVYVYVPDPFYFNTFILCIFDPTVNENVPWRRKFKFSENVGILKVDFIYNNCVYFSNPRVAFSTFSQVRAVGRGHAEPVQVRGGGGAHQVWDHGGPGATVSVVQGQPADTRGWNQPPHQRQDHPIRIKVSAPFFSILTLSPPNI